MIVHLLWYFRKSCVRVVVDYTNTSMTMRTVNENFDGFSQILKEQFGRKRYLSVFTHPIAIIWKFENRCIQRICINTEVTATSFVFSKSVFCLRKPEAIENDTAPVGRIGIYWRIGFTMYIVICEVYIIGWVHFGYVNRT